MRGGRGGCLVAARGIPFPAPEPGPGGSRAVRSRVGSLLIGASSGRPGGALWLRGPSRRRPEAKQPRAMDPAMTGRRSLVAPRSPHADAGNALPSGAGIGPLWRRPCGRQIGRRPFSMRCGARRRPGTANPWARVRDPPAPPAFQPQGDPMKTIHVLAAAAVALAPMPAFARGGGGGHGGGHSSGHASAHSESHASEAHSAPEAHAVARSAPRPVYSSSWWWWWSHPVHHCDPQRDRDCRR